MNIQLVQSKVEFNEELHTYKLNGVELKGVTSTIIKTAFPNKYKDVDQEILKKACAKGSLMHKQLEMYEATGIIPDAPEVRSYIELKDKYNLTSIAQEYIISDNESIASAIDGVFVNDKGEICLGDFKRTYSFDKPCVSLQLSVYKWLFELQNPDLKVSHLYGIWLREEKNQIYDLPIVPVEDILPIKEASLKGEPYNYLSAPDGFLDLEDVYADLMEQIEALQKRADEVKSDIMQMFKANKYTSVKGAVFNVSYIAEKTGLKFDSTKFKKENADLYNAYMKESVTKESIRFTKR